MPPPLPTTEQLWEALNLASNRRVFDGVIITREHVALALRMLRQEREPKHGD